MSGHVSMFRQSKIYGAISVSRLLRQNSLSVKPRDVADTGYPRSSKHMHEYYRGTPIKVGGCGWFRIDELGASAKGDFGDGQFYLSHAGGCIPTV
jgi:hypothetical protein